MRNERNYRIRILLLIGLMTFGLIGGLTATAQTEASIGVQLTSSQSSIVVKGTGSPERSIITLTLTAPPATGGPADIVLLLDVSTSVDVGMVRTIAKDLIGHLSSDDQVAIVSFSDIAKLDLAMTNNKAQALSVVDSLLEGSQTAMGDGLRLAIDELAAKKRANATQLILMPTDGVHNVGSDPLLEAERAGTENLPIYPIGTSPAARNLILSQIASESNGRYFSSYNDSALERIMEVFGRDVVANYLHVTQTLPSPLTFEHSIQEFAAVNLGREVTQLEWYVRFLFEGASWQAQYEISADQDATVGLLQHPSNIEYRTDSGQLIVIDLMGPEFNFASLTVGQGSGTAAPGSGGTTDPNTNPDAGNGTGTGTGTDSGSTDNTNNTASTAIPVPLLVFANEATDPFWTGEAIEFDPSGTTDDGTIVKLEWDWTNDGVVDETFVDAATLLNSVRHAYAIAGQYTVKLIVTDNAGNSANTLLTVTIEDGIRAVGAHSTDFLGDTTAPDWMDFYIDDGVVTDEEVRDASARFAADVFIPGTEYRLTEEDVNAIIDLNNVSNLVSSYMEPAAAEAAGYILVGSFVEGVGQHYVNENFMRGRPTAGEPPVLLYNQVGATLQLAGVRYISTDQNATLFQISSWPNHPASAHYADGTEQAASDINNLPANANSELVLWHPTLYGLTVWVKTINENGLFASTNPAITNQ